MRVNVKSTDGTELRAAGAAVLNPAIAEAVERMRAEEARLAGEIQKLRAELAAVESARGALEGAGKSAVSAGRVRLRAPRGFLSEKIVEVVNAADEPLRRAQIIERLRERGYEFTLAPAAITRELIILTKGRKLKRAGDKTDSQYVAVARGQKRG